MIALAPAMGAALILSTSFAGDAEAKTPGKTYCFYKKCHRVKTLAETAALIGREETVSASFYDHCKKDRYNPCGLTSSGEVYRPEAPDNVASPIYPDGTVLLIWSPDSGASVVARVNNAGPYWGNRKLDVSRGAAEKLGFASRGVATLKVQVVSAPTKEEATYKRKRQYDPVPGYIGQFASLDAAHTGMSTGYAVAGLGGATPVAATADTITLAEAAASEAASVASGVSVPASAGTSADPVAAVATTSPEIAPVNVAALIETFEVPESQVAPNRAENTADERVRTRRRTEQEQPRNSRAYRTAARQQKREATRPKAVATAAPPSRVEKRSRVVTLDGTNDMSMFARHTYAGMDRIVPQDPTRFRGRLARHGRDGNDG